MPSRGEIGQAMVAALKKKKILTIGELGDQHDEARRICRHLDDPVFLKAKGRSLKGAAVAGAIAEWILAAAAAGTGKPFPYDLPLSPISCKC